MTPPKPTSKSNPFMALLREAVSQGVEARFYSPRTILFGRIDVVHCHWPEALFKGATFHGTVLKLLLSTALLLRILLFRIPVVETVHNLSPHEEMSRLESSLLALFQRLVCFKIYLNESSENDLERGVVILHGRYPIVDEIPERSTQPQDRLVSFGSVRPYKGIERLLAAFHQVESERLTLTIQGSPLSREYAADLGEQAASDSRVELSFGFVEELELQRAIRQADLVVLPYVKMYNSGAVLLALSLAVPVLVPRSKANEALAEEVGEGWITMFDPELLPSDVVAALERSARLRGKQETPNLSRRDWRHIGLLHGLLYKALGQRHIRRLAQPDISAAVKLSIAKHVEFAEHSRLN